MPLPLKTDCIQLYSSLAVVYPPSLSVYCQFDRKEIKTEQDSFRFLFGLGMVHCMLKERKYALLIDLSSIVNFFFKSTRINVGFLAKFLMT